MTPAKASTRSSVDIDGSGNDENRGDAEGDEGADVEGEVSKAETAEAFFKAMRMRAAVRERLPTIAAVTTDRM